VNRNNAMLAIVCIFVVSCISVKASADTLLNYIRDGEQKWPSVAKLANGNIAIAWRSETSMDNAHRFNIYSPDLIPIFGIEMPLSQDTYHADWFPFIASSMDSFFVGIFGHSYSNNEDNLDVFVRKIGVDGSPLTGEIRVNQDTAFSQIAVNVFVDDSNDIIGAVYLSLYQLNPDLYSKRFYLRLFDFELNYLSEDIPIYFTTDTTINLFTAGFLPPSKVLLLWERDLLYYSEIKGVHMNLDGSQASNPFTIHTHAYCLMYSPYILSNRSEGSVIIWGGIDENNYASIWARRMDAYGLFIDPNDNILSYPNLDCEGLHQMPSASYNEQNNMVLVTWAQDIDHLNGFKIIGRFFNSDLMPMTDTFRISNPDYGDCWISKSCFLANDSVFIGWDSYTGVQYRTDIYGSVIQVPWVGIYQDEEFLPELSIQVYPNPFNDWIRINYSLPYSAVVQLSIYDMLGRRVESLINEYNCSGNHNIVWEASGRSSGAYIYEFKYDSKIHTGRIILMK
jgi:hypothetical protein